MSNQKELLTDGELMINFFGDEDVTELQVETWVKNSADYDGCNSIRKMQLKKVLDYRLTPSLTLGQLLDKFPLKEGEKLAIISTRKHYHHNEDPYYKTVEVLNDK